MGSKKVQPPSESGEEGLASYEKTVLNKQLGGQGNGYLGTVTARQA